MFDFLEQIPKNYNSWDNNNEFHLLNLMEIEINEAIWKTVSLANKHKEKAIQEYEKLKQALARLKYIQSKQIYRNAYGGWYPWVLNKYKGYFFYYGQCQDNTIFSLNFDAFERKMKEIETPNEAYTDIDTSKSLNDDFKMLELQPKIDQALADLKAKMGL
jgi:ribosomal protein S17E